MSELYTHPNIRDLASAKLYERMERIRGQRLVTAIEFQEARDKKLTFVKSKTHEQWVRKRDAMSTKLAKAEAMIDEVDNGLSKLSELHHKLKILEEELGDEL